MSRVDEIRSRLREQLEEEPGIMSFAYPYVRLWNKLDEKEVKEAWSSLSQESQEGILYTHIPFCLSKCGYCDYATNFGVEDRHEQYKPYVDAVEEEIGLLIPVTRNINFDAVYFGGGTPTILCEKELERIIRLATSNFPISQSAEVSIEVYPSRKMLRDKLKLLKNVGINRVSIGVQDFDDEVIAFTGRRYTGEEANRITSEAMDLFDTVNIDLICGLPKQDKWQQTLERTLDLEPQQITVQPFSNRHPGIRFHHPKYKPLLPDLDQMVEMYTLACDMLTEAGYRQTSRHQFVREGENKYEQKISKSTARLGIGAHSISLLSGLTYKNFTSFKEYQDAVRGGKLPIERGFRISNCEEMRSYLFYSLSADCGRLSLSEGESLEMFGKRIQDTFPEEVQVLEEEGLIRVSDESIDLTPKGVYFTSVLQRTFYNPEFMRKKEVVYRTDIEHWRIDDLQTPEGIARAREVLRRKGFLYEEDATMHTEDWQIEYDMQTPRGVVHVKEALPCSRGFHQKIIEIIEWERQKDFGDFDPNELPLCKVRMGNYIELSDEKGGRNLPLEQRAELTDGKLLASEGHPITLIAPNGDKYIRRKF